MDVEDLAFETLKRMEPAEAYGILYNLLANATKAHSNKLVDLLNDPEARNQAGSVDEANTLNAKVGTVRRLGTRLSKEFGTKIPESIRQLDL